MFQCRSRARANLLWLVGERRWWSRGGILPDCWRAGSVWEFCEACLAGESLAPYKDKEVFQIIKYKRSSMDFSKWRVQSGDWELLAAKGHSWKGVGGGGDRMMNWCLFILEIPFWVTSHLSTYLSDFRRDCFYVQHGYRRYYTSAARQLSAQQNT